MYACTHAHAHTLSHANTHARTHARTRSSAEREGSVQVGDTLLAIGDRVLEGMTTDSLVKLLVGPQVCSSQLASFAIELGLF